MKYTPEQYGQAVALRREGISLAEIEGRTGIPRASCLVHFRKHGVRLEQTQVDLLRGRLSDDVRNEVVRMRAEGKTAQQIANALGLKVKAVYKHALAAGVRLTKEQRGVVYRQRKTTHDYGPLIKARLNGVSIQDLASQTGISYQTLQSELPRRGALMMPRRAWGEFLEGLAKIGMMTPQVLTANESMTCNPVTVICFCGRSFEVMRPHDVLYDRVHSCGCTRSIDQKRIAEVIEGWGLRVRCNVRTVLPDGQEIDVYLPDRNVGVEYHGLYWHAGGRIGARYHLDKLRRAQGVGVRLVQIFESEWKLRPKVVLAYLSAILGRREVAVGARKLQLVDLIWRDAAAFLDEHHIQGATVAGQHVTGLMGPDGLVVVMVCRYAPGRHVGAMTPRWELTRYCIRSGYRVSGGFQRLWQDFLRRRSPDAVVSFSDRRWSVGDLYRRAGFAHDGVTPPSYWYFQENDGSRRLYHKSLFQKRRIETKLGPLLPEETEAHAMERFGYGRIFDCGLDRWVWRPGPLTPGPLLATLAQVSPR